MKLETYNHTIAIGDVTSKNQLLARIAEAFDEMDKWADLDWSRVELATEEDYLEEMTLFELHPHRQRYRSVSIEVPGLPDPVDGEGVEAGPV